MKKHFLSVLQYIFYASLAVFFVWLSVRGMDHEKWELLKKAMDHAHYWLLVPVFSLLLVGHWLRALRWRQLMEPMGYHPSKLNAFFAVMIGYFVNLGAPRLGEVIKCTILARYEKVPAQKLVGTIVAERVFDVICLVLVFGLTFVFQFDIVTSMLHDYIYPLFQNKNGHTAYQKIFLVIALLVIFLIILKII